MTEEISQNPSPRAWIHTLKFSDGKIVTLSPNDIVVLVGPNNAGKSAALKDIFKEAKNRQDLRLVVQEAEIQTIGTNEALIQWLQRTCRRTSQNPSNPQYTRLG